MSMNDKEIKEQVEKWFIESKEAEGLRTKLPSLPYPIKYEFWMKAKGTPLTQVEVQRSMPKERELEGEPTPLSQIKVGEKYKIKVLVTAIARENTYRGCLNCNTKVDEDEDECPNIKCTNHEAGVGDRHSVTYKAVDGTGQDAGDDSVISVAISPWMYDSTPNLVGKMVLLQGRYEMKEGKSKKGKTFESYDFQPSRILNIENVFGSEDIPKEVIEASEAVARTPLTDSSEKPKEEPKVDGSKELFKSAMNFIKVALASMDGKKIDYTAFQTMMEKKFFGSKVQVDNPDWKEDYGLLIDRLDKAGIIELDGSDKTVIIHVAKKSGEK